jgi:O-antigen/teichoic acid export membrane protein
VTQSETFASQVARVYATRLVQFGCTLGIAFLLARLLGPDGRGVYALLLLLPSILFAVGQLGLPSAITYFAGAGRSLRSLVAATALLGGILAALLLAFSYVALPALQPIVLAAAPLDLLRIAVLALPIQLATSFFGSIAWGRRLVRPFSRILAVQSIAWLVAVGVFVGVADLGVDGALLSYLIVTGGGAVAAVALILRERAREAAVASAKGEPGQEAISAGGMLRYGLRLYPAGLTTFLSYRADVFLLSALLGDPVAIGLYAVAVSLAEITFQVPDSVATILYPRVAGSERADADRAVPAMARTSLLVTILAAVALIPLVWLAIRTVLPAYEGSLLPFVILLPGTVALGLSKVLSGYISGLGLPGPVSVIAVTALAVNLVANLILIPRLGIPGAALASLISYSIHAALTIGLASRLAGARYGDFLLVGAPDVRRLLERLAALRPGRRPA